MSIDRLHPHAQVLVFASQKGGSGKTTLSGHIAVAAENAGAGPVALVDADPQGSLAKWWNARAADTPAFAATSVADLGKDIDALKRNGVRLIVIDTPPAVTTQITEIISFADLVVVPTRPSPHDLRAVGLTVDLVERQGKPLVFVVNSATARARITSDTAVTLSQHGTVAPVMVHHRVDFAASMIDGRTVGEINAKSRSGQEIATLWRYLEERLRRLRTEAPSSARLERAFEVELLTPMRAAADAGSVAAGRARTPELAAVGAPAAAAPGQSQGGQVAEFDDDPPPTESRPWHGVERRSRDVGPPPGAVDRRRPPTFGRRTS